jgi:hypothetical protein
METFLIIALAVSFIFIITQSLMLYKMSKWHREDTPPF